MSILNDPAAMGRLDHDGMIERIREFPDQVRDAWANVSGWTVDPSVVAGAHEILVLGMGGSAIGADLVAGAISSDTPLPITVHRGYGLPAWVDGDTLVIASSYSGGTEETLSGWRAAAERGARRLAVTTGGTLAAEAEAEGLPLLTFRYDSQPRAALGHSFTLMLGVMWKLGLIDDPTPRVKAAADLLDEAQQAWGIAEPVEANWPKQIAQWWNGALPVVFGAEHLAAMARRWTTQINENSKAWALWAEMPELNHNLVVGLERASTVRRDARVISLLSTSYHARNRARFDITHSLLDEANVAATTIEPRGEERIGEILWTNLLGDYASYYLAMLYAVDPTPVEPIRQLKEALAGL